ncbi:hypothetical protein BGW80DRAFT_1559899 [Lactifluus volemus]|nr:hypothetical protein BGW80DRAFT_1559899 [Lactifluus volemus]
MNQGRVTIEALPDDVLLDIFESYISRSENPHKEWHPLVHVCRRWRYLVFASPLRLDLRLICTNSSPVREKLDIWPPLLIKIWSRSRNLGIISLPHSSTPTAYERFVSGASAPHHWTV